MHTPRAPGDYVDLFIELARYLHEAGAPAHRIEETVGAVARLTGSRAQLFSTPTFLLCSVGEGENAQTRAERMQPSEYDIRRLMGVDALIDEAIRGETPLESVIERLRALKVSHYTKALRPPAFMILSASMAVVFGGGLYDAIASAAVGLAIGAVTLGRWRSAHLLNITAAFVASLAGAIANRTLGGSAATIALASLIALIPGLTLTLGLTELATRHLTSGTSRLMAALIAFLELGFGAAVGQRTIAQFAGPAHPSLDIVMPEWIAQAMVVPASLGLLVLFNVPLRRYLVILISSVIAFLGARFGALALGPLLGVSLGAFAVGAASNAYARIAREPATLPLVPAVLLLVPGSIGYRGLESYLAAETAQAIDAVFATFVIGTSIVTGLLMANTAVAPRRLL